MFGEAGIPGPCQSTAVQSVALRLTSACTTPGFSRTRRPPHLATGTTRQGLLLCNPASALPFLNRSHPPGFSYCLFPASEASSATASHSAVGWNGSACCSSFAPQPPIQQHEKLLLIPKGTKANIKESHKGVIRCPPAKEGGPFSSQPAACAHLQHSPMGISSGAFAGHRIHTPVARKKSRR